MEGPSERKRPFGACRELKPYIFMIFVQLSFAGMTIVAKFALNEGMSPFTFVVYRHVLAAVVVSPFAWFFERPVLDQNLYYLGMKKTSAAFTAAMSNLLPAITFVMAWVLRLERVSWNEKRNLAKLLVWLYDTSSYHTKGLSSRVHCNSHDMLIWRSIGGGISSSERAQRRSLEDRLGSKALTVAYSAVVCSGLAWCLQGSVMKRRGPVFVTAFSPLSMIVVAIVGLFFLAEDLLLGRLIGAVLIMSGLYMVVWGKRQDQRVLPQEEKGTVELTAGGVDP
uniref:WAT1-related protein n=1 Tax=Ananas comosus var. bracteatus TaxID=296719 RepID=A0A6V7NUY6_ANACO|nr:unnamed protein product [Ananas comosus var. bracteatus]